MKQPLRLIRHGRFLSPSARFQFRLHRMATGHVFLAEDGGLVLMVISYLMRIVTLPVAVVADFVAIPILRMIDRTAKSWWVVEVRFHGWDAEFVRIAEAATERDAKERLAQINSVNSDIPAPEFFSR